MVNSKNLSKLRMVVRGGVRRVRERVEERGERVEGENIK
tara:strand:- start:235 stop:351 length:117 start_codon:yes stop_codon:yes gene_type:complete